MADGFIVRKGGLAVERTTAPSINFVSKTNNEIVVTFTNNDAAEAEVYYGITSTLTDTVTLAAAATSSNITFSGLDAETTFTVSAYALVTDPTSKKIKSEIVTTNITTDIPAPTITLVSKTDSSITFTLTNNSVEERDVTFGLTTPPTTTTISLASQATSGNQTFSNLDDDTTFIIFAQAEGGLIGQLSVTTDLLEFLLRFDGVDDLVNFGNNSTLFPNTTAYTFEARFFYNTGSGTVFHERNASLNTGAVLGIRDDSKIRLTFFGVDDYADSTIALTTNAVNHVALTISNKNATYFINGSSAGTFSVGNVITTNQNFTIFSGGTSFTEVDLFFMRFWSVARNQTQINDNKNTKLTGNISNLVANYNLEEGQGTTMVDSAGNNNGTIVGATFVTI